MLHSSDINVFLLMKITRNRAQALSLIRDFKIFKRDYLVKISEVSLTVSVAERKAADNTHLAQIICKAFKSVSSGLQITRIQ